MNLKPGDKVAIQDRNIEGKYFYIEAEVFELTPAGFLITSEGTFDLSNERISLFKKPVIITDHIREEIEKLQIRKYIHNYLPSKMSELALEELRTIRDIIKYE